MKIFGVPMNKYSYPFDKFWKRILMHLGIAFGRSGVLNLLVFFKVDHFIKIAALIFLSDITQTLTHIFIHYKIDQKYDWLEHTSKRIWNDIFWHTLATFVLLFTIPVLCIHWFFNMELLVAFNEISRFWWISIIIVAIIITYGISGEFFKKWKASLASESKLQAQMMNYKYEALRNQINPHFLLDSFNSLKQLVNENEEKAVQFIQKISDLYRHVLDVKDKEFITLDEELEFIKPYLALLKSRYNGQLKIDITVEPNGQLKIDITVEPNKNDLIVPLALQFLIENAVERNLQNENDRIEVSIKKEDDKIVISNTKNQNVKQERLPGTNVNNIIKQYQFYTDSPVRIVQSNALYTIKLPILKQA